jgi:hypothetical protein
VFFIQNGLLPSHEEWNYVICRKMDETTNHNVKQNKQDLESDISYVFSHMSDLVFKNE